MSSNLSTTGLGALEKRLERAANAAKYGVVNVLRQHAAGLQRQTKANIGTSAYRMPELTAEYKKRKKKKYGRSMPVLVASGKLMKALRTRVRRVKKGVYSFRHAFPGTSKRGTPLGIIGAVNFNLRPQARFLPPGWSALVLQSVRETIRQQREQR